MRKIKNIAIVMTLLLAMALTGCSSNGGGSTTAGNYASAKDVFEAAWNDFDEDAKFPCYGGSMTNPKDDTPDICDLSEVDFITTTLLISADAQKGVKEVASLVHFMNPNSFTGVVAKVDDSAKFIASMKDAINNNMWMCGVPEKMLIVSVDDYVFYCYGDGYAVEAFEKAFTEHVTGAKVEVSEAIELM